MNPSKENSQVGPGDPTLTFWPKLGCSMLKGERREKGKKRTRRGKRGKIGGNKEPGERMKGRENETSQETGVGWPGVSQHKNPGKWPAGADEARESLHRGPGEASAKDGRPQVLSWAGVQSAGQESRCWKLE